MIKDGFRVGLSGWVTKRRCRTNKQVQAPLRKRGSGKSMINFRVEGVTRNGLVGRVPKETMKKDRCTD